MDTALWLGLMSGACDDDDGGGDDDDDDDNAPSTRGYKHRINQFFWPRDAERVDAAVKYVHSVMCDASLLIKYRLVKIVNSSLDRTTPPMIIDETLVSNAIRAITARSDREVGSACRSSDGGAKGVRQTLADAWATDYAAQATPHYP